MNNLTELPAEVASLAGLTSLEVSDNRLTSLPASLTRLAGLASFSARSNSLAALPGSLGGLAGLTYLDVSMNGLKVGRRVGVGVLFTRRQKGGGAADRRARLRRPSLPPPLPLPLVQALDPSLTQLSALQQLSLSMNPLEALPPGVTALRALRILEVRAGPVRDGRGGGRQRPR